MGIYGIKPRFRRRLERLERALIRAGVSADTITAFGIAAAGVAGFGMWLGRDGNAWLALVPLGAFMRTAANALDGMVASSTGTARPLGEVFNEVSDRVGDVAMFLPLMTVDGVPDPLVAGAMATMLTTSYLGLAVKAAGGQRLYTGVMGKPDRMFVLGAAALVAMAFDPGDVFTTALGVILAGCGITFVQRGVFARSALVRPRSASSQS